jgi:hypothetical protein
LGQSIKMEEALTILQQKLNTYEPSRTLFFK